MPLLLLGFFTPRLALFLLWLFTDYLDRGYGSGLWPTLGFFFLPATTLAYAIAQVSLDGLTGWGLVVLIGGIFIDTSSTGWGAKKRRRRRR